MEIVVSEDFELTQAIKTAIHERVEQIKKHLKTDRTVKVFLSKTGHSLFKVQMVLNDKHKEFSSHSENEDFYMGLNDAKAKIIRQINDYKEKKITKRHQ